MAIVCNAIEEDSGLIPAVLWDTLYSAIQPQAVPDHGESARLKSYLSHWSCAPRTAAQPSFLDDYYGCVYVLEENPWHLRTLSLSLRGGTAPYFPGNGSGILYSSGRSPWGLDRQ